MCASWRRAGAHMGKGYKQATRLGVAVGGKRSLWINWLISVSFGCVADGSSVVLARQPIQSFFGIAVFLGNVMAPTPRLRFFTATESWSAGEPVMELYHLKTFVTVAEEQHLTRAAERLFTSQPAISAHIKALEEELRLTLFERTPKGMQLTPRASNCSSARAALAAAGDFVLHARQMGAN